MAISIEDIKTLRAKTSAGMALCKEALTKADGDMAKATEYINSRSDAINRLHNLTGAKIGLCKLAFEESEKDFEKAVEIIKERGWDEPVENECASDIGEGIIETYVHGKEQKLVALVEARCKTDFVARNEEFRSFVHEVALQVAAMKPKYVSKESISEEKLNEVKEIFMKEAQAEGKPANIMEKIVEGKLQKFYEENCLLEQKWFKDDTKTIRSLLDENVQKLGEPIEFRRLLIWEFGK
jgi:elongation factor Ts